ncbi:MAG: hypothetical protein WAX69_02110, partial [Victivallales bacterium]
MNENGYIITNCHVADGGDEVSVKYGSFAERASSHPESLASGWHTLTKYAQFPYPSRDRQHTSTS